MCSFKVCLASRAGLSQLKAAISVTVLYIHCKNILLKYFPRQICSETQNVACANVENFTVYCVSLSGQQLWVLALGLSPRRHTVGIPEFKYVANMHGNEVRAHTHTHTHTDGRTTPPC